jgi:hypothetical protein
MSEGHFIADLLEPEEWQALIDAGLIPAEYSLKRHAEVDRITLEEWEHRWL